MLKRTRARKSPTGTNLAIFLGWQDLATTTGSTSIISATRVLSPSYDMTEVAGVQEPPLV